MADLTVDEIIKVLNEVKDEEKPKPKLKSISLWQHMIRTHFGGYEERYLYCSSCNQNFDYDWKDKPELNYCPNCGAEMVEHFD